MRYVLKEAQNNHRCNLSVYSAPPPKKKLLGLAYKIYNGNKAPGVRRSGALPMFHIGGYHWISGANFRFFSLLVFGQKTWFKIRLRDLFLLRIRIPAKEDSRHRSCFAVAGQHVGQLVEPGACVAYIVEQKHMPSLETVVMYAQVVYFTLVKYSPHGRPGVCYFDCVESVFDACGFA